MNIKKNIEKARLVFIICLILLIFSLFFTGCATSTTHFERQSETEYTITQRGQADVEVKSDGTIKITNPQSTIGGLWEEVKDILKAIGGRFQPTAEVTK